MNKWSTAVILTLSAMLAGCATAVSDTSPNSEVELVETGPDLGTFSTGAYNTAVTEWVGESDEFDGVVRWKPKYTEWFNLNNLGDYFDHKNVMIYPLVVRTTGSPQYGWGIYYRSGDWIFFDEMQVIASGETFSMPVEASYNKQTDVSDGKVIELSVSELYGYQLESVKKIADDNSAKFRLRGSDGSVEREFLPAERRALQQSLQLYMGFSQ